MKKIMLIVLVVGILLVLLSKSVTATSLNTKFSDTVIELVEKYGA